MCSAKGHAVDIAAKTAWAVGVFTQGGFEKIVELNPQSTDYVIWAMSGTFPCSWLLWHECFSSFTLSQDTMATLKDSVRC